MKKTHFNKPLSLVLAVIMIISALPLTALPSFAATSGDWAYSVSNNEATITEYKGTASKVTIPSEIDGYSVTSIGQDAFYNRTSLTSVTIPNSVTRIGYEAFRGCTSLASVTIGGSVTSIGSRAFAGCTSLKSVTIPNSVTSIGPIAFSNTAYYNNQSNWKNDVLYIGNHLIEAKDTLSGSYAIKQGTKSIADNAFYNCTSLTSITIPDSVTSIGQDAFRECTSLTSVIIPDSVTSIGSVAFLGCTSLTSITIPDSVTRIGDYAFDGCTSLTSVTIPDSVTSIGGSAFYYCTSLTSITIPDSVTSIGVLAFSCCTSLQSINVDSNNQKYCSVNGALFNKDKSELIQYPAGKADKEYTIPNSVTRTGDYAFYKCTSLTSITIPDSVTSIGQDAFRECTSLTRVIIPDSVTFIGGEAFYKCTSLKSVTIPNSVISIFHDAFRECTSLQSINVDSNNPSYCSVNGVLFNKDKCELIQYPAGKTDKQYSVPNSVTSISTVAFYRCTSLTSVTILKSVTSISGSAFSGCTSLTIYGYTGSYAETYAKANNIPFKVIGTEEPQSDVIHNGFKTYKKEDNYQGENGYYFKNSYFDHPATRYNQSLATMSLCLAFSTYGYGDYDKYDKNVKTILNQCGFEKYEQYHFNEKPTADSIGCVIACKELPNGTPLIAIAVRSSGYESEWASNLDVGLTGDHYGFNDAAGKVVGYVKNYFASHPDITGDVKIWITGFSRAAATATQAAAKLNKTKISNVSFSKDSIYAYGFATPAGAIITNNPNGPDYDNIFNIIHYDDIVPLVAPAQWGFGRYGKTLVFLDKINCKSYSEYAPKMYKQFNKIDKNYELDNFSSAINTLTGKEPLGVFNRELINSVAWSLSNYDSVNARLIYRTNYQEPIKLLLDGTYGGDDHEKLGFGGIELLVNPNTYLSLFNLLNLNTYATATAAYNAKYLAMAHANPSYYLAWMQSMDINYYPDAKPKFSNGDYRFALFNCAVDINVYDNETNKLVVSIKNEKPVEIEGSSIVAIIDDNGQKVIYLPVDGDYRIETVSRDSTEVTASVIEKYGVSGIDSRVCNFSDISTNKKDNLEMIVPSYSESEILNGTEKGSEAEYQLSLNDNNIQPTLDINGTEQINEHMYSVTTEYDENGGTVYGEGQYLEDSFVMLTAEPKSCYEFEGFYIDGKKITDDNLDGKDNTVRVEIKKDVTVEAKFVYKGFPDVKEGSWYYDAVQYCAQKGYISGYQNGNFGPNDNLKRQDFVVILSKIAGADLDKYAATTPKLKDVKKGAYYAAAVNWAVDNNIIAGYANGNFGVNDNITREQVATILYRYMGSPEVKNVDSTLKKFSDVNRISSFAKTAVAWAVQNNVISGMADGRVAPTEGAARAQIASIIMRMDQQGMFDKS